jgi:hypothetical protein
MKKCGLLPATTLALGGLAAIVAIASPAMAQCTNDSSGAIQDIDDQVCGATTPDANGGCNVDPEAFQSLGVFSVNNTYKVAGKVGTYGNGGNRDLDWFTFTVSTPCKVQISAIVNSSAQESVIQVIEGGCDGPILATSQLVGCNSVPADTNGIYVEPGVTYIFLLTTPFEADTDPGTPAIHGCASYVIDIATFDADSGCLDTPANKRCDTASNGPGCEDWSCCNEVCFANPLCCITNWDASCASFALANCTDYLFYNCAGTGPANSCIGGATELQIDAAAVAFTTANAGVDGWLVDNCNTTTPFQRNVWAKVTAPSSGNLITTIAGTGFSGTLEFYSLGSTPITNPGDELPGAYIGCINVAANTNVAINGLLGGDIVYIRYAQTTSPTQNFTLATAFDYVIFNTGGNRAVNFNGALTNLGYSSGDLSTTQLQRWMAVPFNVPAAPGSANGWGATSIVGKGFVAAAPNTVTDLNWIIWTRENFDVPVDGDQVASGSVPIPAGVDEAEDDAANAAHFINLATPLNLCPGDYYLTLFGSDPTPPGQNVSNWAWFTGAQDGIFMTNASGPFGWRSSTFPAPGFQLYTTPAVVVPAGLNPNSAYSCAFRIIGDPTTTKSCQTTPPCPADFDGNGDVGPTDLGILLGAWGPSTTADLDGDGNVGPTDLGILLGAWGPCPN